MIVSEFTIKYTIEVLAANDTQRRNEIMTQLVKDFYIANQSQQVGFQTSCLAFHELVKYTFDLETCAFFGYELVQYTLSSSPKHDLILLWEEPSESSESRKEKAVTFIAIKPEDCFEGTKLNARYISVAVRKASLPDNIPSLGDLLQGFIERIPSKPALIYMHTQSYIVANALLKIANAKESYVKSIFPTPSMDQQLEAGLLSDIAASYEKQAGRSTSYDSTSGISKGFYKDTAQGESSLYEQWPIKGWDHPKRGTQFQTFKDLYREGDKHDAVLLVAFLSEEKAKQYLVKTKGLPEKAEQLPEKAEQLLEKAEQLPEKAEQLLEKAEQLLEKAEQLLEKAEQLLEKAEKVLDFPPSTEP